MMQFNRFTHASIISCICLLGPMIGGASLCSARGKVEIVCHTDYDHNRNTVNFNMQLDHVNHRYLRITSHYPGSHCSSSDTTELGTIDLNIGLYISGGIPLVGPMPIANIVKNADGTYSGTIFTDGPPRGLAKHSCITVYSHDGDLYDSDGWAKYRYPTAITHCE